MIREHSLPPDSKMILYIDAWTVHRSKEFRNWIKEDHPEVIVLFVPAGCTGIFQPCDVGLQRLFKHNVKRSASCFFVDAVQKEREQGVASSDIRLPTSLPKLRDATPVWIQNAVEYLNMPIPTDDISASIGASAWKNCRVHQWNLSYECITSAEALGEWFKMPADFRTKIEGSQPLPNDTSTSTVLAEDCEEDSDGDDEEDVPLSLSSALVVQGGTGSVTLPSGYQTVGNGISYDEAWDEEAQLIVDSSDA